MRGVMDMTPSVADDRQDETTVLQVLGCTSGSQPIGENGMQLERTAPAATTRLGYGIMNVKN